MIGHSNGSAPSVTCCLRIMSLDTPDVRVSTSSHNLPSFRKKTNGGDFTMRHERLLFAIPLLFFTLLVLLAVATTSADDKLGPYTQIATIPNPALASFDISWADSAS